MHRNRNWLIFLAVCLCLIIILGCQPTVPKPATIFPIQRIGTIHLEGDSVTLNTYYATGVSDDWFTSTNYASGSTATASWTGIAARENVPKKVSEGGVEVLVWALGLNDAAWDGFTLEDRLIWTDILHNKTPRTSCIVLVKPWQLDEDNPKRTMDNVNAVRSWMDEFHANHDNVILADWKPILEANRYFSARDGVHLDPDTGAAAARNALYFQGVQECYGR